MIIITILFATKLRGDMVHWQNFDRKTLLHGENILQLTVTEDNCLRLQTLSDDMVISEVLKKLRGVYGDKVKRPIGKLDPYCIT